MMIKFKELIKNLRAFTILIVENDFTYIENSEEIVGRLCLSKSKIPMISEKLRLGGYEDVENKINAFFDSLDQIGDSHDLTLLDKIGPSSFNHYLDKINQSGIANDLMSIITKEINDDNSNEFKNIFFNSGILDFESLGDYNDIIKTINSIPDCQIIFRKEYPSEDKIDELLQELEITFKETKSNFCLSIIDKLLGRGDDGGRELIETIVKAHKEQNELKHICCLYTSKPGENLSLNLYEEYFIQEVRKNSNAETINKITSILAQCAYAEVFNSLRVKTIESAEKTLEIVLKNQKNIKYIIDKSHEEGIPPYDAIKYWNTLSIQNEFDSREIEDFRFIASLASLFNKKYLDDNPNLPQVGRELKLLNTYELFDYNVNKKHLPIAPGDIWESNGNYYILVGQLCDLLLRGGSNKRKSKIAELFKIEFGRHSDQKHKYDIIIDSGKKIIYIDYFLKNGSDVHETLKIDISTPNICFADLSILDLSMFNESGECSINIDECLNEDVKLVLPTGKDVYYEALRENYIEMKKISFEHILGMLDILEPLDFSKFKFEKEGSIISHKIKRICRLKGRYFDSLYNNYLNNKGRIDLNLIDNIEEEVEAIILNFELGEGIDSKHELRDFHLYKSKKDKYIKLSDLKLRLPAYEKLFSYAQSEKLTMDSKLQYELIENNEGIYTLQYKYHFNNKDYSSKSLFSFKDLFSKTRPDAEGKFLIEGNDEELSFIEEGHPKRKISIEELKKGIFVPDEKQKLKLINGVLEREVYEE
ncbi:hypothetical protein [Chryseobacterium jejuense]|uniref:hypothetical protein n=1 Tax=Chryseobacterium jejuense TaxID=445960 RepID=UPI001AE4F5C2|nr:hypothetical protein [Chryseobacterium jejuense]MBP2615553.1 hypothetical protein [Chryseobacterium jejuense]